MNENSERTEILKDLIEQMGQRNEKIKYNFAMDFITSLTKKEEEPGAKQYIHGYIQGLYESVRMVKEYLKEYEIKTGEKSQEETNG